MQKTPSKGIASARPIVAWLAKKERFSLIIPSQGETERGYEGEMEGGLNDQKKRLRGPKRYH